MDEFVVDPSSTPEGVEPSPQPAAPAAPAPEVQPPFHLHPRFRELTSENRTLKAAVANLTQRFDAAQRQAASGQAPSTDEQRELASAASALKKIFAADPELKALFEARLHLPGLAQGYRTLTESQQSSQRESARSHVATLAKAEGLPTDPKWLSHLTRLVAGAAMGLEDGNERFENGDFGVLTEAFEQVKNDFFTTLRTANASVTGQTKLKTKGLPPAPRGGQVGEPAPEGVKPGEERKFTQGMHKKALAMIRDAATG